MPADLNIKALIEQNNSFTHANSVRCAPPIHQLVENCLEWERKGVPFVVQGVSLDAGVDSPFSGSTEWLKTLSGIREPPTNPLDDVDRVNPEVGQVSILPCPIEWSGWLGTWASSTIPTCLLPHKTTDEFPESVDTTSCVVGASGRETAFEEGAQGTTNQYLLCACDPGTSVVWFMTSSREAQNVSDYLRGSGDFPAPRVLSLNQLAEAPFKVYVYVQRQGDLVVLPPRSYYQQRFQGVGANMSWSRMTLRGLEFAIFYDFYQRQRMCIPARFRVKSLACQAMTSRFERLKSAGEDVTPSCVLEMRRLLAIINEILGAESQLDDNQLPPFERDPPTDLACASCGGEIFRAAFCCVGTCLWDGETEVSDGSRISICPLCFVDGRTCSCQDMRPIRVREIGPLIETKNTVQDFIHDVAEKLLLQDEDQTASADIYGSTAAHSIVMAALILCRKRSQSLESTKACTFRQRQKSNPPSHSVSSSSLLRCTGCHSAKCFHHILASSEIHSSTALLIHAMDADQKAWHKYHVSNKNDYADGYSNLMSSMKSWSRYNLHHRLVYFALNFRPSQFISGNVLAGFYDATESGSAKPPLPSKPKHKKKAKPSGSDTLSVQKATGPGSSKGSKERFIRSRTPSASPVVLVQPLNKRKRALSPEQSAEESSVQETSAFKRPRTRAHKAIVVSDDPDKSSSALGETARLVYESDEGPTTEAVRWDQEYSPAKPLKSFDPEVDVEVVAGPSLETPRQYPSAWSNLISSPKSSEFNREFLVNSASSTDIRGIIKETFRELIPQYLGEALKVSRNLGIVEQPPAPERLPRGISGLLPFHENDSGLPSEKGSIYQPHASADFSFKVPEFQIPAGGKKEGKKRDNHAGGLRKSLSLGTPLVETRGFDSGVSFPPTPMQKPPRRNDFLTNHHKPAHSLDEPTLLHQSGVHQGSPDPPLSHGNRNLSGRRTSSMVLQGSSPTLHMVANRSLRQHPETPQKTFNNRFPQPNMQLGGDHRAGNANPFVVREEVPHPQPSRPIGRVGSAKSIEDGRRRRDVLADPPSSESSLSPENLLDCLRVMEQSVRNIEGKYSGSGR